MASVDMATQALIRFFFEVLPEGVHAGIHS